VRNTWPYKGARGETAPSRQIGFNVTVFCQVESQPED
jgi:hypothetical protein